jgi:hypothetical protein
MATIGAAPTRQFAVTWDDMSFCCGAMPAVHFAVTLLLYEGSQVIETRYDASSTGARERGSGATIGVQNSTATSATQYSCNSATITAGTVLRFVPVP